MKIKIVIFLFIFSAGNLFSQVELLERSHSVYEFLKRMDVKGVIDDFNSAKIPLSRYEVARQLSVISSKVSGTKSLLNKNDIEQLNDYLIEFEFDVKQLSIINYQLPVKEVTKLQSDNVTKEGQRTNKYLDSSFRWNDKKGFRNTKWYNKPHYIYSYNDSNATFFLNLDANMYQRNLWGDSLKGTKFNGGDIGVEFRGTLFNRLGYALRYTNGKVFVGNKTDKQYVLYNDESFRSSPNLWNDGKWFDKYAGYVRFEAPEKWVSLMFGKESVSEGFGYINKLYVSNFSNPIPFLKLDFKYKAIEYSFLYGNINTDSFGVNLAPNKMISMHRLDVKFLKWLRAGFWESVITSSGGFSFVHLNPLSFITSGGMSADVNTSQQNNSMMGFDAEFKPVKNLAIQGTLLIDDINLSTISNDDYTANDNKFGYQAGILWNDAFTLPGLLGKFEYTRLDPFVFTHRENRQQYTLWGAPLGHSLPPNTDEKALQFSYNIMPRLRVTLQAQFQRSGEGFTYDSLGNIDINYGGDINHGERFYVNIKNTFLQGNRVNRNMYTIGVYFEPVRFCYIDFRFTYKFQNLLYLSKKLNDRLFWMNLAVKI
jgi:hypothetical protein